MANAFSDREMKLIRKIQGQSPETVAQIKASCPLHSYCNPLPLFRLYKIDDASFEAQWNEHHLAGPKQVFRFEDLN